MTSVLVIPAYNPDEKLIQLVKQHQQLMPQQPIIVVNDGSSIQCKPLFDHIASHGITVLHHPTNLGKGAALKTAFRYYLSHYVRNHVGVITADADGQHHIDDIAKLKEALANEPDKLHLGARNFSGKNIPLRSRFGNLLTKFIVNCFYKTPLHDTQSGLRAIPNLLVQALLDCKKNRYEFELEMFFIAQGLSINIKQIPIKTIYMQNNQSSHFHPILDSMRIYAIFFRYGTMAAASFLLDFTLFCLLINLSGQLAISVLGARFCSATFNFFANKKLTFKSQKSMTKAATKYTLLAAFSGIMVWQLTSFFHYLQLNVYLSKISADIIFFFANFLIQRYWVFRERVVERIVT
ncbi:glycosyltransferase [Legionella sp. W05-934-2]|uniref:glycosyltransferase n=1 Tax=Legionella sp. W05-934-2 TaxID=1198649 RepID=UPI003461AC1A